MPSLRLVRLSLTQFRNYPALTWRPAARIAAIFGPNGSGKTNLLEAVSLLMPGRGLRGARIADLARRGPGGSGHWGRSPAASSRRPARPTSAPARPRMARPIGASSASTARPRAARRRSRPASARCG